MRWGVPEQAPACERPVMARAITVLVAPVPLPAAGGLLLAGLAGLVALRRKRNAA